MKLSHIILLGILLCFCSNAYSQENKVMFERTEGVVDYDTPIKYLLKDVKFTGIDLNTSMLLNSIGLHIGDSISVPSETLSNSMIKLWRFNLYSDAKMIQRFDQNGDLHIEIALKDLPYVSNWDILGVTSAQKRELLETLNLARNIQYSEYMVDASSRAIRNFYSEKGFYNTEVNAVIVADSVVFRGRTYVKVDFHVDKKERTKIQEIMIAGLDEDVSIKSVKASMKNNKEKKLINFFKGSKFKEDKLEEDLIGVVDYLQSLGYRNARVISDSIYAISEKRIGIKVDVFQGDKYYYRNLSWTGNQKYPVDYLNDIVRVKKGDVYDSKSLRIKLGLHPEAFQKAILNVTSLYQDNGYLTSQINPVETEVAKDTVDVEIKILEGEQFSVNEVHIRGNVRTHDRVIRRELFTKPGELYSQELLRNSIQRLGAMGNFEQESLVPEIQPVPNSSNLTDVTFNLEEGSTDNFQFSGGFGGGTFVLGIGVTFKNLSLRKLFNKGAWKPYPSGDNQVFQLQVQSNGTYYKNISVSFMEPWLGGKKPNSLSTSLYYSTQTNGVTVFDAGNASFATLGASVGFGTRLSWPDPYFTFSLGLKYQHYNLDNWTNFLFKNGISHIIALEASLNRKSVNSPYYPSSGSDFGINVSATPPYSLFNNKDYSIMTDQERYKMIEYFKFDLHGKWYQGLTSDDKLVLYIGAAFGYLGHYNPNVKSPFEGYNVGGAGVGGYNLYGVEYVGLRGYADGSLTPRADYGDQASVYSKFTAEIRYPFVNTPGTTMFALVFAEAGNAGYSWRTFNPFDLKKSVGAGIRVFLPVVGMFGIDFGYGFDNVPGESKPSGFEFHFSMGQEF